MEQDLVTFLFFCYFAAENFTKHEHDNTDNYG